MGFNTNTTNRLPAITAIDTTYVFDISVLPAPVSNVITLLPGNYVISNQVAFGLNSLKFDSVGQNLTIQSLDGRTSKITSSTTGTFLDVVNALDVRLFDLDVTLSGAAATFWNILGVTGTVFIDAVIGRFTGGGVTTIGTMGAGNGGFNQAAFTGFRNGLTVQNIGGLAFDSSFLVSDFMGTGPFIKVNSVTNPTTFSSIGMFGAAVQSAFDIEANFTAANVQLTIDNVPFDGATNYFTQGTSAAFTAPGIVDGSTGSFIVSFVNNVSGAAEFETNVGHGYAVGDLVFHTTFTESSYLGSFTVTQINSVLRYEVGVSFVLDETGNTIGPRATITSTSHGLSNGTILKILDTINFNNGYVIENVMTNTFRIQLSFLFPGAETTGSWDTGSLDETDRRVVVSNSGKQKNSMNVAFGGMNANAGATTIAIASTYQAMDFNTVVLDPTSERWTLINATSGIFRYDGLNPVTGTLVASITVVKTGSTEVYRFTDSKNGAVPTFATKAYMPIEVKTTQVSGTLIRPISVVPGDTIQVMGAGDGTTNSVTLTDFFMEMMF